MSAEAILIDETSKEERSIQELAQLIVLLGMEITWRGIANVFVNYSGHVDKLGVRVAPVDQVYEKHVPHLLWFERETGHIGNPTEESFNRYWLMHIISKLEELLQSGQVVLFADLEARDRIAAGAAAA